MYLLRRFLELLCQCKQIVKREWLDQRRWYSEDAIENF